MKVGISIYDFLEIYEEVTNKYMCLRTAKHGRGIKAQAKSSLYLGNRGCFTCMVKHLKNQSIAIFQ